MENEYYDFNEPVHSPLYLKAQYSCFYEGATLALIHTSGEGTVRIWNRWNGPITLRTKDGGTTEVPLKGYVDYNLTSQTVGSLLAIGSENEDVFRNWVYPGYDNPNNSGTSIYPPFCERLDPENNTIKLELHFLKPLTAFLLDTGTTASDYFFEDFCSGSAISAITSEPGVRVFDTSSITKVGKNFFYDFLFNNPNITSLPEGSFDTSNIIVEVPTDGSRLTSIDGFFDSFNFRGGLQSLPTGSFKLTKIQCAGDSFFWNFNRNGALTELPEGSFNTENIKQIHGAFFFANFNSEGKLAALPSGSFRFPDLEYSCGFSAESGYMFNEFNLEGDIELLPAGSFALTKYKGAKALLTEDVSNPGALPGHSFSFFAASSKLRLLPAGSFVFPYITGINSYAFYGFAAQNRIEGPTSVLEALPANSFAFPQVTHIGNDVFGMFLTNNPHITQLPAGSFYFPKVTNIHRDDTFIDFANNSGLIGIPANSFNISKTATLDGTGTSTYLWRAFQSTEIQKVSSGTQVCANNGEGIHSLYTKNCVDPSLCGYVPAGECVTLTQASGHAEGSTP